MNRIHLLAAAVTLLFMASCSKELNNDIPDDGRPVDIPVEFTVPLMDVKSSINADENIVANLTLFVFSEGLLVDRYVFNTGDDMKISLVPGRRYRFYAFANRNKNAENDAFLDNYVDENLHLATGKAQTREEDMDSVMSLYASNEELVSAGFPMAYVSGEDWSFRINEASVKTVKLPLERLVSKWSLLIKTNDMNHGRMRVRSVILKNSPSYVYPFRKESRIDVDAPAGHKVEDFSSTFDVDLLNRGEFASFYVLENMQGTLLPDNRNPADKTPENIGDKKDVCTYLEVVADYESDDGIACDALTMRMYLGKDNCSNFDIERNTESEIVLSVTDKGVFAGTWKVEMTGVRQNRTLSFVSDNIIEVGKDYSDTVVVRTVPAGLDYEVYFSEADRNLYGLTAEKISEGRYVVRTSYTGEEAVPVRILARTWDGLTTGEGVINLDNSPYTSFPFVREDSLYTVGGWYRIAFPDGDSSHPVRVGDINLNGELARRDTSSLGGTHLFYSPQEPGALYLFCSKASKDSLVVSHTRRGCTATRKIAVASLAPRTDGMENITLLEDGRDCRNVDIRLSSPYDGSRLTKTHFMVPSRVVTEFGYTAEGVLAMYFPARGLDNIRQIAVEKGVFAGDEIYTARVYGLSPVDTVISVGMKNIGTVETGLRVSKISLPDLDRFTIYNNALVVGRDKLPIIDRVYFVKSTYKYIRWELERYRDIDSGEFTDKSADILSSCIHIDEEGEEPLIYIDYPEMADGALTTIDNYAAYPAGAYTARAYFINARSGEKVYRKNYDFDVVTTVPLGTYIVSDTKIPEDGDMSGLLNKDIRIHGKVLPADFRFHKSYDLWNRTMANLLRLDYRYYNNENVSSWRDDRWTNVIVIDRGTAWDHRHDDFEGICKFLYDKLAEKHFMEFSIRAPYERDVTPYVERKEYTIDRKEIEEHRDEMSYRGENGFYRFIRTDALFDEETDVVVRDLINCRFCDWEDIYEGEKYKWMWW